MKKTFVILGLSVVFLVISIGVFFRGVSAIKEFSEKVIALDARLVLAEQKNANIEAQRRSLRQLEREGVVLDDFFFKEEDALRIVEELEALGLTYHSNVSVDSVQTLRQDGAVLGAYVVSVDIQGAFADMLSFIERIQSEPRVVKVHSFELGFIEDEGKKEWKGRVLVGFAYVLALPLSTQ